MKILIIPSWYKNKNNPVSGSFFEEQARALMKMGHDVSIFHVGFNSFSSKVDLEDYEGDDKGLYVTYRNFQAKIPRNRKLNYQLLCFAAFRWFKKHQNTQGKPDIIHAHSVFYGGIVAKYLSHKLSVPYIITEHLTNLITNQNINKNDTKVVKEVLSLAQKTLAVSNNFRLQLLQRFNLQQDKITVLHNMVDSLFLDTFVPLEIEKEKEIRFFTNSFIVERKNHKMLLSSFKLFLKVFPNSKLIIGGAPFLETDKIYYQEILELQSKLELGGKVLFTGPLSRKEVKQHMDDCHIFLLASFFETFGVVLIEALGSGRPVITTPCEGPDEIVTSSNGIIVNSFEKEDFTAAMIAMVEKYNQLNQKEIRSDCKNRFSAEKIVGKLEQIYLTILKSEN